MRAYPFMYYIYLLPAAFLAPVIHESVKAMCSARLGDPTPRKNGLLSGNPLKYFEPVGFFCILIFGYGWGRPVQTSALYYKDRVRGTMIVYIVPSFVNLLAGIASAALLRLLDLSLPSMLGDASPVWVYNITRVAFEILYSFSVCNIGLALFNTIPVYPLDGAKILQLFLKPDFAVKMNQYEKIFQIFLLILLGLGLVRSAIDPIASAIIGRFWFI